LYWIYYQVMELFKQHGLDPVFKKSAESQDGLSTIEPTKSPADQGNQQQCRVDTNAAPSAAPKDTSDSAGKEAMTVNNGRHPTDELQGQADKFRARALLPCKSPMCSVHCSPQFKCDGFDANARCQDYIDTFRPPPPLTCNLRHMLFAGEGDPSIADETPVAFIPIGFAVHPDDILSCVPDKAAAFSAVDPANRSTYGYSFSTEALYRRNMAHSYYAMTMKKAGWDAMRHYEIIASGSVPYFSDLQDGCPDHTLPFLPKMLLTEGKRIADAARYSYDSLNRTRALIFPLFDADAYGDTSCCLLQFARRYLTSVALAQYVLDVTHNAAAKKVLILFPGHPDRFYDYLTLALIHGMRTLKGVENVGYFPSDKLLFELLAGDTPFRELNERQIWGLGYSWAHRLEYTQADHDFERLGAEQQQTQVEASIRRRDWDVIIYGTIHRGMPLWDLVQQHYTDRRQLVFIDAEDFSLDDHAELEANYHPLQWPPFNMRWRELALKGHYFKRELGDTCPEYKERREYVRTKA
jgi:hypothetical protein